jgi:transposase-like protein
MAKGYPAKLKFQVVMELLQSNKTTGQVARAYGIHPNTAAKRKRTCPRCGTLGPRFQLVVAKTTGRLPDNAFI